MSDHEEAAGSSMSERIMGQIAKEQIAPKPRWHFLLHEGVIWAVVVGSFILGSIASALTLYIADASSYMAYHAEVSEMDTLLDVVPFLWLILIVVGVFYTVHALHATRRGYRWQTAWLVTFSIVASLAVGWGIHTLGGSEALDRFLLAEVPMYKPLTGFKAVHWMNVDQGIVAGFVESVRPDGFTLRALDGRLFDIATSTDTEMPDHLVLTVGMPVRVLATTTDSTDTLQASDIRPFHGRGGMPPHDPPAYGGGHVRGGTVLQGTIIVAPPASGQ